MYLIELIFKIKNDFKNKKGIFSSKKQEETEEEETCFHTFSPVDSTGKILSCTKCGLLIERDKLPKIKERNFFKKRKS